MSAIHELVLSPAGIRGHNSDMPEGLTTDEFAAELGTTSMAVRKMLDRGLIKGKKHGSMWFIPRSELEKVRTRKRGRPKITKE